MPHKGKKLGVFEFGEQLLETNDLDPVYVILWEARSGSYLTHSQLCRWLIAYWCFYHVGTASYLSEFGESKFFKELKKAVPGTVHPRGAERRHFRGQQALRAAEELLSRRERPVKLVAGLGTRREQIGLLEVMRRVKRLRGFGDWIAFKAADTLERLDLCPVEFTPQDVFNMFDAPRKGAQAMAEAYGGFSGDDSYVWAYDTLLEELGTHRAPPRYERNINIQEIETILCKWKSHLNDHYWIGKDLHEIRKGLIQYSRSRISEKLLKAGEKGGLW